MSIKAIDAVWDHSEQTGTRLLVMLAIADYAHDDGTGAYPGVEKLAEKARLSDTMVRNILKELEEAGEIKQRKGVVKLEGGEEFDVTFKDITRRVMEGKTRGKQRKTRPKNGEGKGFNVPKETRISTEETRISTEETEERKPVLRGEETRVSSEGNTGSAYTSSYPSSNTSRSRVSDETRPSSPSASKKKTPAVAEDAPEPSEPIAPPAVPTTWDDVEAAPAEARRAGRKWTDEHLDWYEALVRVTTGWTRIEFEAVKGERVQKRYHAAAKRHQADGHQIADLLTRYEPGGWFNQSDWRGKDGRRPDLDAIDKTWGDWLQSATQPDAGKESVEDYNRRLDEAIARSEAMQRENADVLAMFPTVMPAWQLIPRKGATA